MCPFIPYVFVLASLIAAGPVIPPSIEQSVTDRSRPASQRATDVNRKPAETLVFAGIRPDMVVCKF